ncbi:KTSC domain-containing protein [Modestobacter sp. DSM 44400]|uniref:KTSC domain-containing protein n=1 Tax=Modestobacter sp. DSM 44400 TaxID=1550230 RepID=UPI001C313754|nr:KTSC domain-containing protein [Modestobacter sp. DSM 44400]
MASSSIVSVGYDPEASVLEVEFQGNRVYQYLDVPPEEFDALMEADSKGRFVNGVIKPAHPYRAA